MNAANLIVVSAVVVIAMIGLDLAAELVRPQPRRARAGRR